MNKICDLSYYNPIGIIISEYLIDLKIILKDAIYHNNYNVCKTLLNYFKELTESNSDIFLYAVQQNNDKIIKLILNYINYEKNNIILDYKNSYNDTPLNFAALNGNLELCKFLIYHNVNIQGYNEIEDKYGNININSTPLYCAVNSNNYKLVKYLLKCGADPNRWSNIGFNYKGYLPLHTAIKNNNYKIAKLLILYDANPYINEVTWYSNPIYDICCETIHHNSPLFLAIKKEKIKFLKLFKHYYDVISKEELIKLKTEFINNPKDKYNYSSFKYELLNKYY